MLNLIIGLLLILTFVGLVVYVMKGGDIMLGFLAMTILWIIIGGIPVNQAVNELISQPAMKYGSTIMVIVFGSWFGRVLVETGIASDISRQVIKLSYRWPLLAALLVCLITAFIFTSAYGVGAVIAIAVILLPILESLGLKKNVAVTAFVMSIGAPMYVNIVIVKQIQLFFPQVVYGPKYLAFGFSAMAVQLLVVIGFVLLHAKHLHRNERPADQDGAGQPSVNKLTYILPVLPVLMNICFKWEPIPGLMLAIALALLLTGKLTHGYHKMLDFINQTIKQSVSDIATLIVMLMFLAMFSAVAVKVTGRFEDVLTAVVPHSPWLLAFAFGLLAPLALFRGPLMVWGAGSATAAVLAATGFFNPYFAFAMIIIPSVSMAVSTCITQSWNLWVVQETKLPVKTFLQTGVPFGWLTCLLNAALAVVMFG